MNGYRIPARCFPGGLLWLSLSLLLFSAPARSQQLESVLPDSAAGAQKTPTTAAPQKTASQDSGQIRGQVVDQTGITITGATVKLTRDGEPTGQEVTTDEDGKFYFFNVPPGSFHLSFTSPGLETREISATLDPSETYVTPLIELSVAKQVTEVRVELTPEEVATAEIKEQEKQRVFGIIPNFYVSYVPNAAPLKAKHKFELAWKSSIDPFTFVAVGMVAGFAQAGDRWSGYGQGAQGYAKRFGATYANVVSGTFIGGAILPTLLKQDPRYFYKGKGSTKSRLLYALGNTVICKGDNGHWQANYSAIGGGLASGGISYLYYPAEDRNGAALVFQNTLIGIGETAAANLLQEFLIRKLTPNVPGHGASTP